MPLPSVFGLLVSRVPVPGTPVACTRLFTFGVLPLALNGCPSVLAALG